LLDILLVFGSLQPPLVILEHFPVCFFYTKLFNCFLAASEKKERQGLGVCSLQQGGFCFKHSTFCCSDPYVTGTSVLGIKYKDGILMAADTLGELPTFLLP
jgi:hypothetical protein